jgi:hypothetical protein
MNTLSPEQLQEFNKIGETYAWIFPMLVVLALWSVTWKGLALWKAARRNEKWWFVPLLVVNMAGILEILYLFVFSRKPKACCAEAEKTPASVPPEVK